MPMWRCAACPATGTADDVRTAYYAHYFERHHAEGIPTAPTPVQSPAAPLTMDADDTVDTLITRAFPEAASITIEPEPAPSPLPPSPAKPSGAIPPPPRRLSDVAPTTATPVPVASPAATDTDDVDDPFAF